jgi:hypothetical protein
MRATCPDHLIQLDLLILVINASALYMEIKSLLMSTFCNQNKLQYSHIHRTLRFQSRETRKYWTENDCSGHINRNLSCPTERKPTYTASRCTDSRLPIGLSSFPLSLTVFRASHTLLSFGPTTMKGGSTETSVLTYQSIRRHIPPRYLPVLGHTLKPSLRSLVL